LVRRALFTLHVQNPQQEYWSLADIANLIAAHPSSYMSRTDLSKFTTQNIRAQITKSRILRLYPICSQYTGVF